MGSMKSERCEVKLQEKPVGGNLKERDGTFIPFYLVCVDYFYLFTPVNVGTHLLIQWFLFFYFIFIFWGLHRF